MATIRTSGNLSITAWARKKANELRDEMVASEGGVDPAAFRGLVYERIMADILEPVIRGARSTPEFEALVALLVNTTCDAMLAQAVQPSRRKRAKAPLRRYSMVINGVPTIMTLPQRNRRTIAGRLERKPDGRRAPIETFTRAELRWASGEYRRQAREAAVIPTLYERIEERLGQLGVPDDALVLAHISVEQIDDLREEIEMAEGLSEADDTEGSDNATAQEG